MALIVEDLFLLLVDDVTGKPVVDSTKFPRVLAGALVLELALTNSVRIAAKGEQVKVGRLMATDPPSSDPLLARAYSLVAAQNGRMKPQKAIEKLQKNLHKEVRSRLSDQGVVSELHTKVLGLFPTVSWPARDVTRENTVLSEIGSAIVDGTTPPPRIAALISLVSAIDAIAKVLPGVDKKAAKKRAKEIAEGDWASAAVRKAVQDVNAAVVAAVMVPVVISAGS